MKPTYGRISWLCAVIAVAGLALAVPAVQAQEPVEVTVEVTGDAEPGAELTAAATVVINDGSTIQTYAWTQETGVTASITGADTDTATVTLGAAGAYRDALLLIVAEPPIAEEDLPPNVELPEGEFPGGLQNRFQIVGLNPFSLEEAALVTLKVEVTTTSGTYSEEVEVHAALPWKVSPGLRDVPIGLPVLLHGKDGIETYDWALTAPGGSSAALVDETSQNPYFTPDVAGLYTVTVTDTTQDPASDVTIEIYAGTWDGSITGQDGDGLPLAADCTSCHNGSIAPDKFTPWAETGHAEIFSVNLDTSTHYGESCFGCHTVGFDLDADNGGMDDAADYADFLASGLLNNPGDNWTTMLADYPDSARLANIQCENCHGPQNSTAHTQEEPRVSLSSDVCGVCHGEPLRHARFQQWQLSRHANYELAIEEGQSGSCSRCHTGNGFVAWTEAGNDPDTNVTVTWTEDETHPQTCATCHDPHAIGTTTGRYGSNATVRVSDNTPLLTAGFTARGVGKGAICMTCHNSRRGLRNDDVFATITGTSDTSRAPHGPTQTDIVMGQNAYLVTVGIRGSHSLITDTCVNCHMEQTDPPDLLAYNLGGTNHTFAASTEICQNCHGSAFNAQGVQSAVELSLDDLHDLVVETIVRVMADQIAAGNVIDLDGEATIDDVADVEDMVLSDSHGRQAIIVTLTGGTDVGPISLNAVAVLDPATGLCPGVLSRCELYDFADARLPKAAWNWMMVNNDGSDGVHNPDFVLQVLDASIAALVAVASGDDVAAAPDTVKARFSAVEGTLVSLKVKAAKGSSRAPTITLRDGSGAALDLGGTLGLGPTSAQVKNFEIIASGSYTFEIGGTPVIGNFQAKTAGKFPKKHAFAGTFPADDEQSFEVMPGSTLKSQIKAAKGSAYQPAIESVEDKGGALTLQKVTAKGSKAGFKSAVATAGATVTMTLGGTGTGDYTGSVNVKTPKVKKAKVTVSPGPAPQDINLGDSIIGNVGS